jgi:hypothetical protein
MAVAGLPHSQQGPLVTAHFPFGFIVSPAILGAGGHPADATPVCRAFRPSFLSRAWPDDARQIDFGGLARTGPKTENDACYLSSSDRSLLFGQAGRCEPWSHRERSQVRQVPGRGEVLLPPEGRHNNSVCLRHLRARSNPRLEIAYCTIRDRSPRRSSREDRAGRAKEVSLAPRCGPHLPDLRNRAFALGARENALLRTSRYAKKKRQLSTREIARHRLRTSR